MVKTEIRLSGKGGQGIIKIAMLIADAALKDGRNVIQSQAYGPESRGGASKGEVVISDKEIYYPKVEIPDIVLCLSQEACDKYAYDIKDTGILIIDTDHCRIDETRFPGKKIIGLSIILTAKKAFESVVFVGAVALGALTVMTNVVSEASVRAAFQANFKPEIAQMNCKAFETGLELAKSYEKNS